MPKGGVAKLCGFISKAARDAAIKELWIEGKSATVIAKLILGISAGTVYHLAATYDWPKKNTVNRDVVREPRFVAPPPAKTRRIANLPREKNGAIPRPTYYTRPKGQRAEAILPPPRVLPSTALFWTPGKNLLMRGK